MKNLRKLKMPDKINVGQNWYKGGTLHASNLSDFHRSTFKNALATCSDWVVTFKNLDQQLTQDKTHKWISNIEIKSGGDLLQYSLQLTNAIILGTEKHVSTLPDYKTGNVALVAALQLGWIKTEPLPGYENTESRESELQSMFPEFELPSTADVPAA